MPLPAGEQGGPVISGDFNNDGIADVAEAGSGRVSIWLGNGDGTFQNPASYAMGNSPYALASGDFNNDGNLDLVATGSGTVWVLLGNGDGTFPSQTSLVGSPISPPAVGEFNGDGNLDLAINTKSGELMIFYGQW
jgi:hypothetical protein